jgi:hypothetical protein
MRGFFRLGVLNFTSLGILRKARTAMALCSAPVILIVLGASTVHAQTWVVRDHSDSVSSTNEIVFGTPGPFDLPIHVLLREGQGIVTWGFFRKGFADQTAQILNSIDEAFRKCNKAQYELGVARLKALLEFATAQLNSAEKNSDTPELQRLANRANNDRGKLMDLLERIPGFVDFCAEGIRVGQATGGYLGGELAKNWGRVRSTETRDATGVITNQFTDTADPLGGGIIVGYTFAPWANNIVASAFASFDFLHAPVNHTFPGGSFLGSTANFMGTAGVKIGPQLDMGLWLYGIAGVSVLNETLNVNFVPVASSTTATVPGVTVGLGGAWQPAFLQGFGRPVSLFLEYQHTWWQSANFNTPAASTAFNYNFARQDDVVKFGFTVSLAAQPPPPAHTRGLITK